ncbi:MAG: TldD/PmbA family protein [Candidatus Hodarchaeales archaeon]
MISELDIPSSIWKLADQIELFIEEKKRISVTIGSTRVKSLKMVETGGITARVLENNRPGWTYSPLNDIEKTVEIAKNLAKKSTPHEQKVSFINNAEKINDSVTYADSYLQNATVSDVNDIAEQVISTVQQFDNISCRSTIHVDSIEIRVVNSNGVDSFASFTKLAIMCGVNYHDPNKGVTGGMAWFPHKSRFLQKNSYISRVEGFCQIARENINPVKATNKDEIIFSPLCVSDFITRGFVPAISAKNVFLGKSPLADRIGENLGEINIVNRVNDHQHGTSTPFDTEGVKSRDLTIIDKGILVNYISDSLYSSLLGLEGSTGNLFRQSYDSKPQIWSNTLSLQPLKAESSLKAMIEDTKQGIIANGFAGNVNPVNGSFSGLLKTAFAINNGEQGPALKEVNIRGNIYDLFKQEFTSDGTDCFKGIESPYVKYRLE